MPTSKHRRKSGGKSIKHPGRNQPPREVLSPIDRAWRRFAYPYLREFRNRFSEEEGADLMLEIIIGAAFNHKTGAIGTISKEAVFREFMEQEDGPAETLES